MPLYRLLLTLAAPVLAAMLLWRVLRGVERPADLAQRLGGGAPVGDGALWLHGASNGELASARPLILALRAGFTGRPLVVTCNTTTGRALVAGWGLDGVTARLAPLDLRPVLERFRKRTRPALLIVLENEFWPNRIATFPGPVLAVGARMSARSARRWQRLGGLARPLFGRIARLWPQDDGSAAHFRALGVAPDRIGPVATLKSAVAAAPPSRHANRDSTILAASTHAGEDQAVLDAFVQARRTRPDLRLILAPRHPARRAEIEPLVRATGLRFSVRSRGAEFDGNIYLADTLGEMGQWYARAGTTFVGGSLVDRGGHTPFEPAAFGSAILHGPHTANFAAIYAALDAAGGAVRVSGADGLARAVVRLGDAQERDAMTDKAQRTLRDFDGGAQVVADVIATLKGLLPGDEGTFAP